MPASHLSLVHGSIEVLTRDIATWVVVALGIGGVVLRPFHRPEAVWAVGAAAVLVAFGLLPAGAAWRGVSQGADVYLFLTGMMLLSELARREGLFAWVASRVVPLANGSASRLFLLIYAIGTLVTVLLSNDATAVVLTPAVAVVVKAAEAAEPLPYLLICAIIANAASFVLPISNPANLVIYGQTMPPLLDWLPRFALPAALAILASYVLLKFTQRRALAQPIRRTIEAAPLSGTGWLAGAGIILTVGTLLLASGLGLSLGLPTFLAGVVTAGVVLVIKRESPWGVARGVSWGVLPLVAGLFVLVAALDATGATAALAAALRQASGAAPGATVLGAGLLLGFGANLVNNLPAGLIAGHAAQAAQAAPTLKAAMLIGIDLGPNLSVTGSLATILWLTALRREGLDVGAWRFLKLGAVVMPPALLLALGGLFLNR